MNAKNNYKTKTDIFYTFITHLREHKAKVEYTEFRVVTRKGLYRIITIIYRILRHEGKIKRKKRGSRGSGT